MGITDRRGVVLSIGAASGGVTPGTDNAIKAPVRLASVGHPLVLTGLQTIDGFKTVAGDRVLVKDQDDPAQNGIYNAAAGAWTRSTDADSEANFSQGMLVDVAQGFVNAGALYVMTTPAPATLGVSAISFSSAAAPATIQAVFDGGGQPISTGLRLHGEIGSRMTIRRWTLLTERPGNLVIDIWRAPFASLPLSAGNSITGGAPPALANQQFAQSTDLTAWQPGLNANDVIGFNIQSVDVHQRITLSLWGTRP